MFLFIEDLGNIDFINKGKTFATPPLQTSRHLTGSNLRFGGFSTFIKNTYLEKKSLRFSYREIHPYFIKVYYSSVEIKKNGKLISNENLETYQFQVGEGKDSGFLEFTTTLK